MRIVGRVKGPSSETTEQSVKFVSGTEYFFLPRSCALPSYSPWIEYDLSLQARPGGSICDVTEVFSARKLPVEKDDLIDHMVARELSIIEDKKLYRTSLKRLMKNVPETIEGLDDVEDTVELSRVSKIVFAIGKEWDREQAFFDLLPIFPAGFLNRFSPSQILIIAELWKVRPQVFCFWDKALDILAECGFLRRNLSMHPKWPCVAGDDLSASDDAPAKFSSAYPILSANVLIKKKRLPVRSAVLREAISIYVQSRRFFYSRGQTCFFVPKDTSVEAVSFLLKERILRCAWGDFGKQRLLATHKDELVEVRLALTLSSRVKLVRLINCPYYNAEYGRRFAEWYEKQDWDQCALMSANSSSAAYMGSLTGFKFSYGNKAGASRIIVFDRAHKISPSRLLEVLSKSTCKDLLELHLFGDSADHGVNCFKGGGRLFRDLEKSARFDVESWSEWDSKDPLRLAYSSLEALAFADLSIYNAKDDDQFGAIITGKCKTKKQTKRERIIFCSTEADRKRVVQHIVRIMDRTPRSDLYVGQRMQVMETDRVGEITKGWELAANGERIKELQRKDPIEPWRRKYDLLIDDDKIVNTERQTVERADVCISWKYAGRPFDEGIFVVGKSTTKKDLLGAVKYCLKKMSFVFIDGTSLPNLKQDRDSWSSDLITKISKIRKGF